MYAFKPNPSLTILLTDLTDISRPFAIFCTILRGFLWSLFFAIFTDLAVRADHFRPRIGKLGALSVPSKHFIMLKIKDSCSADVKLLRHLFVVQTSLSQSGDFVAYYFSLHGRFIFPAIH